MSHLVYTLIFTKRWSWMIQVAQWNHKSPSKYKTGQKNQCSWLWRGRRGPQAKNLTLKDRKSKETASPLSLQKSQPYRHFISAQREQCGR
jgi:hypothetical protein